jgi:hypothetical protein
MGSVGLKTSLISSQSDENPTVRLHLILAATLRIAADFQAECYPWFEVPLCCLLMQVATFLRSSQAAKVCCGTQLSTGWCVQSIISFVVWALHDP